MTQLFRPSQVFEIFFDPDDLFKNLFAAWFGFLAKAALYAAKPSIVTQFFALQPSF